MSPRRFLKWLAITLAIVVGASVIVASISNWNWLRGPLSRQVAEATGRALTIRGDLEIHLGAVNPALALMPLIDVGSGKDSDCSHLIAQTQATPSKSPAK